MGFFIFITILFGSMAYGLHEVLAFLFPVQMNTLRETNIILPFLLAVGILIICVSMFSRERVE